MALIDNLVSYWKCDESSGTLADAHGSNNLTNNNSTAFTTGIINNGSNLVAASSNYFSITDASQSGLDFSGDMSISLWFKPSSNVTSEQGCICKYINAGQKAYRLYFDNGVINFQTSSDGTTGAQAQGTQSMSSGTWYHIVITKSGTTCVMYVNGSPISVSGSVSSTIKNGTDNFYIGTRVASGDFANGVVDEIGMWSKTLDSTEVAALYNSGAGFAYPFTAVGSVPMLLMGVGK